MTVVIEKLSPKTPGFIAREVTFLKRIIKRLIKSTLPSPARLDERMWHPKKSAKAYSNCDDFVCDGVPSQVEQKQDQQISELRRTMLSS